MQTSPTPKSLGAKTKTQRDILMQKSLVTMELKHKTAIMHPKITSQRISMAQSPTPNKVMEISSQEPQVGPSGARCNRTRQRPGPDNDHTIWSFSGPEISGPDNDHLGLDNDQSLCGPRHTLGPDNNLPQWSSPSPRTTGQPLN